MSSDMTPSSTVSLAAGCAPAAGGPAPSVPDAGGIMAGTERDRVEWLRILPYLGVHVAVVAVFWVGVSWAAVAVAAGLYLLRMFAITGFYHRYFSHRAYRTSRWFQFVMALIGCTAGQRGPLWWAAHHRHHHAHSDDELDRHSPRRQGFWWAHMGWFTTRRNFATELRLVRDWTKFPELVWLDRFNVAPVIALAVAAFGLGELLRVFLPALQTNGAQMLIWGFFVSTVLCYHATYTINSLAHVFGTRRYATTDDSRNSALLALLTLGEGWHNNHHHYPASARQGFRWWEIDITYYGLCALAAVGLVRDLKPVPVHALVRRLIVADPGRTADTAVGKPEI